MALPESQTVALRSHGCLASRPMSAGINQTRARLVIRHDGELVGEQSVSVGETVSIPVEITHGGPNIFEIEAEALDDELTLINNRAVITIDGIRENLRVLLVSGEPHAGERTWRNLLKSDAAVDLVHFDLKHMDTERHRELTGGPNDLILDNLKKVSSVKSPESPMRLSLRVFS